MSTLSNVDIQQDKPTEKHARFVPDIIPEAISSRTGVSVSYVQSPAKSWYVLRATYGRVEKASDILIEMGEFIYMPTHYVRITVDGKSKRVKKPLLPSLLFAYLDGEKVRAIVNNTSALSFLTFYYDHFSKVNGKNPPLIIPQDEMYNFIKATCTDCSHVRLVDSSLCHYKSGDLVEVSEGPFAGVRGRVARVTGQQRVVVALKGVCTVATAYIPTAFLTVLEQKDM